MERDRKLNTVVVASGGAANQVARTIDPMSAGTVVRFVLVVPNFTNVVTAGLTIRDEAGNVVWSIAGLTRDAAHSIAIDVDIFPLDTIRITTSGDIGAGANLCTLYTYIRR